MSQLQLVHAVNGRHATIITATQEAAKCFHMVVVMAQAIDLLILLNANLFALCSRNPDHHLEEVKLHSNHLPKEKYLWFYLILFFLSRNLYVTAQYGLLPRTT